MNDHSTELYLYLNIARWIIPAPQRPFSCVRWRCCKRVSLDTQLGANYVKFQLYQSGTCDVTTIYVVPEIFYTSSWGQETSATEHGGVA